MIVKIKLNIIIFKGIIIITIIMMFGLVFNPPLLADTTTFPSQILLMSSTQSSNSTTLNNSSWRLDYWEDNNSTVELLPQIELSLNFKDDQVFGFGGCNNFGGSFKQVENQLSFGTLQASQKGCEPSIMEQEAQFFSALESVNHMNLDISGKLMLCYEREADKGVLHFVQINET